jgi:HEAT repeat protein
MGETRLAIIYCDSTPEQARRILITLRQYLADSKQEPQIRLEASQALADIGTPECASAIREAISQEQNPDYRMFFAATLKGLETNLHRCSGNRS